MPHSVSLLPWLLLFLAPVVAAEVADATFAAMAFALWLRANGCFLVMACKM
jgi:hypothetical protein